MTDSATIASSHQGVLQGALPATSNRLPTCRQAGIKAGGRAPPFASLGATSTPHPPATSPDAASSPPPPLTHSPDPARLAHPALHHRALRGIHTRRMPPPAWPRPFPAPRRRQGPCRRPPEEGGQCTRWRGKFIIGPSEYQDQTGPTRAVRASGFAPRPLPACRSFRLLLPALKPVDTRADPRHLATPPFLLSPPLPPLSPPHFPHLDGHFPCSGRPARHPAQQQQRGQQCVRGGGGHQLDDLQGEEAAGGSSVA